MNAPPSLIRYDTSPRSDLVRFFRVFRLAGRDLFEQMFVLGLTNIAAMLLLGAWTALPQLLPLAAFAPPLLAGLWSAAARVARAEETSFHDVWEGAQDHFARSWLLAAVSVVVYGVVWMNITFYTQENVPLPFEAGPWVVTLLLTFWLLAGIFWTLYWSYILAWLTFEEPHLWPALKGAAWLLISHGPFTILLAVLIALFFVLNTFVHGLLLFITWAVLACFTTRSVQVLLHGIPQELPPEVLERILEQQR